MLTSLSRAGAGLDGFLLGAGLIVAIGACVASFVWYCGLTYSARALAPTFGKPSAQRVLDLLVCAVMWVIAAGLVWNVLGK